MARYSLLLFSLLLTLLPACKEQPSSASSPAPASAPDPHSFARPAEAAAEHLRLRLVVDMEGKQLEGEAIWQIRRNPGANSIIFDTKTMEILAVEVSEDGQTGSPATFVLGQPDSILGRALVVSLPADTRFVHIRYRTSPEASALQFVPASQTHSRKAPFLLTQSQAIHARSWVPCQDSPGQRFTYEAEVQVPQGLMALMSATNPTAVSPDGLYRFRMEQRIPSYLLALAVGDIAFQALDERSGVYAEPTLLTKAAAEFVDVPPMIAIAENLYGPYRWERYDILVLPPSFPFGGMENPRLTFATPTILAGDRSLVSLVAHELAHSWSGNLVTNATWNDFWLNEGFTVYVENRIMEALQGAEYAQMLAGISRSDLLAEVEAMGADHPHTRLAIDLRGFDPDDGVTSIAYDKGFFFLKTIENTVGREAFDAFLSAYFSGHAFQTMTTEGFLTYLRDNLLSQHPGAEEKIGVENWVYGTGIPDNLPAPASTRFAKVEEAAKAWAEGRAEGELGSEAWSSHEWVHFLRSLPASQAGDLARLDAAFNLTASTNSEVQAAWYVRAIQADYRAAIPAIRNFLTSVGRRKFLMPLYGAMMEQAGWQETARSIYAEARPRYHPIAVTSVDQLLSWNESSAY